VSLTPKPIGPIPEDTLLVGQQVLSEDNLYRIIGEQYAEVVKDEDFADFYSHTGQPGYSPARLSLITVLQAMEHLSDRVAIHMVRTRIDWKYALHLPLNDPGFDPSVLCEFRGRLVEGEAERKFFDALLEKFKEKGLLKGRGMQRTDSLQLLGAVRVLNRLELVMETLRLVLESMVKADVEWVRGNVPAEWFETYGEWNESERLVKESGPQGKAATGRFLKQTGKDGFRLMDQLKAESELRELEAVKTLEKVWGQQYRRMETTEVVEVELSTKESRRADGVDREIIVTPHDVDVRYSEKRGEGSTGYKLHLTETAEEDAPALITDLETVGGQEYDGGALEGIHERLEERGLLPEDHLGDKGYVNGNTIAESHDRGVNLVGPVQEASVHQSSEQTKPEPENRSVVKQEQEVSESSVDLREGEGPKAAECKPTESCLGLEKFQFDFEQRTAICPKEIESARWVTTIRRDRGPGGIGREAYLLYWDKEKCLSCELALPSLINQQRGRIVQLSPHHEITEQRRAEQQTKEFRKKYRRRSGVEASLSAMVRGHGGRRTRYRGKAKTRAHYLRIGSAMNLKRAIAWENGCRPKRVRVVRMKKALGLERAMRLGWR